jgi:hypothetical protein
MLADRSGFAFRASGGMLSGPEALAVLREQQAGFRKDRSCTDQRAALRIIIEQSLEWNTS